MKALMDKALVQQFQRQHAQKMYELISPLIKHLAEVVDCPRDTMLDIGSSEGALAEKVARDFNVSRLILTDLKNEFGVAEHEKKSFHAIDVCRPDFVEQFRGEAQIITCVRAFHEFTNPYRAALNALEVLPANGFFLLVDHASKKWEQSALELKDPAKGPFRTHLEFDHYMVTREGLGLDTDAGIQKFWKRRIFPRIRGRGRVDFYGGLYSVMVSGC